MRAACPLLLSLTFVVPCAAQSLAAAQYKGLDGVALYSHGYVTGWDSPAYTRITVYGRDAQAAFSVREQKNGIYYVGWAVDSDGFAAGVYQSRKIWQGRIDLFDPNGRMMRTIDTGSYIPQHVAFAADHTIWAEGYKAGSGDGEDFDVLHHYARSGQELGQMLRWSQIAGSQNSYTALQAIVGGRRLYIGRDRIGFEAPLQYGHSTWVEVSFSGTVLGKYNLGSYSELCYVPHAMTSSGGVYAAIYKDYGFDGWAILNRSTGGWDRVTSYPQGRIIGSDGENVVFSTKDASGTVLRFVPPSALWSAKLRPAPSGAYLEAANKRR